MIILRQNNFSINYSQYFPRVINKKPEYDIEGINIHTVKSILRDWKNTIAKNVWENDKDFAIDYKLNEKDYINGLALESVSYDKSDDQVNLTFGAWKNTKLHDFYGSDFFWCLSFSGKTGKFITIYSGD